jgi:ribosomal protein L29
MGYNMMSQELRKKTIAELKEMISGKKGEILELSKAILKGSEKNVKKINFLRKEVARISTILNEKVLISTIEEAKNE